MGENAKYNIGGVIFEFATRDVRKKDYVHEEMAQQAARNEAGNMLRLFAILNESPALHHLFVPLMTILSYRGFTIIGNFLSLPELPYLEL